jgi:hypothetical protein
MECNRTLEAGSIVATGCSQDAVSSRQAPGDRSL